jgi:hypothetical protein
MKRLALLLAGVALLVVVSAVDSVAKPDGGGPPLDMVVGSAVFPYSLGTSRSALTPARRRVDPRVGSRSTTPTVTTRRP